MGELVDASMLKINILSTILILVSFSVQAEKSEYRSPESVSGAITTTPSQAKKLFDDGVAFIDVRNPRLYARGHIPRAFHLDFKNDYDEAKLLAIAEKSQPIVIYCSGVKCSRSYRASAKAVSWGFQTVHYFRGGIVDWKKAGYPVIVQKTDEQSSAESR